MRFLWNLADSMLVALTGINLRPAWEELRSALDDVPCSHCGLTDHSQLRSQLEELHS